MKTIYTLAVLSLLSTACKTRKVALAQTTTSTFSQNNQTLKKDSTQTDTIQTNAKATMVTATRDSFEIEITPDTGTIKITNGNYTGKAKQIVIKGLSQTRAVNTSATLQKQTKTTHTTLTVSTATKTQTQQTTKQKLVTARPAVGSYIILLVLLVLLALAGYLLYKFKKLPGI